jgi:hypothetical protein
LALESSAQAEAFRLLLATVERAGEEGRLAAEVNVLKVMVEGQTEYDREARLLEELRLQDAHDELNRLRKEQETPKKLKGKKKKKAPSRNLWDKQRAEQRRAKAEKLVARLEAERVERAHEEDDDERTDWREVAQDDLDDSDGEPCFVDPRQAAWAGLPQDPREVPKDEAVLALRSLVRAVELNFRAGVETTTGELAAATTSGAGLAKKQSKVFDPGGGL